jgi:predicted membrane-bound spermidine synthase
VSKCPVDDRTAKALSSVDQDGSSTFAIVAPVIYVVAFVTGGIVMSFEMLGSRYLNPYFGSGIYTWASLISTVLAALCVGYFIGGWLADRAPSLTVLGVTVIIGSAYLVFLPSFAQGLLEHFLAVIDDIKLGSLVSSFVIMFFPVTLLGMYSPFAIRLLMRSPHRSGVVSGTVYGISTAGSIVGTLGTTFYLIPIIGSRAITIWLGVAGLIAGLALLATKRWGRVASAAVPLIVVTVTLASVVFVTRSAQAEELIDLEQRKVMLGSKNGLIAHIETAYNDIFITKTQAELSMSFQVKGWEWDQSAVNLRDADDLPFPVARQMTMAVVYPEEVKKILMIGLGGGTVSAYLGRYLPEVTIDTVEIDPGVIAAAKKYFGMRETSREHFLEGDGRVFLTRNQELYDLIIIDAFHGGYAPFHLLTKEFYTLVKERLKPNGAAAFNVPDNTRLYVSTIVTLRSVFPTVDLYPAGDGEVITIVTPQPGPDQAEIERRAVALQEHYGFRFKMPALVGRYLANLDVSNGVLLSDDFAPAELYNARDTRRRKK